MQDENYLKAALPESVVCLKLPLRKFLLGHKLLLTRARSPFIVGERAASFPDLMHAVLICSDTYEGGRDINHDPLARLKIWLWGKRIAKADFLTEQLQFRNYIEAGQIEPDIRPGGGRSPGSPWLLRLKQFLVSKCNLTESQAWNFPYSDAVWNYCAHFESEGACEVRNEHDQSFLNFVAEQEAKAEAEAKAKEAQ